MAVESMARLGRPTGVRGKRPQRSLPFEIELVDDAGGVTAHAHSGKTLMRVAHSLGELVDLIAARQRLLALTVPPAPA